MGEGFRAALQRQAATLCQALADAAEAGDVWMVAVYSVDLEELQRLGRTHDVELPVPVPPAAVRQR
ncbi:hypothetical protein G3I60_11310 [Streptomyces sp. SID13666]|uniref:hypothetical protein n=1 Tax=Streptomyces TaxID=1883 RepID=UPI001105B818|nr:MULTISPECIES: hypothetical protein [Streptomyces]MCZ4101539.1 hypothetical protein [Streptomyces sp. H39-C1]NEA54719.1 hypothetical protein [Streptomyces sp. SID13666]NEA70508.1 hypothetical protein [Streptomyces sp. SID13588]QNA77312.1 hypothetical protein C8250_040730 [Streptomyces sp. So13.3]